MKCTAVSNCFFLKVLVSTTFGRVSIREMRKVSELLVLSVRPMAQDLLSVVLLPNTKLIKPSITDSLATE